MDAEVDHVGGGGIAGLLGKIRLGEVGRRLRPLGGRRSGRRAVGVGRALDTREVGWRTRLRGCGGRTVAGVRRRGRNGQVGGRTGRRRGGRRGPVVV